ncbi:hypothetical protein Dimus_035185 [Dionaea muscipula]
MVVVVVEEEDARVRWGTWEELILGGAVLRHGTENWDAVASELQSRTLYPFVFTAQACQAKYVDLQQRYYGSTAWFDELRKSRVVELKKALEKAEDSIGSLESKLEILKAEKGVSGNADYSSSRTESPAQGNEYSGKDVHKDGLSAGSFTQEQADTEPVFQFPPGQVHFPGIEKLAKAIYSEYGVSIRRKRGERKRRVCVKDSTEGSVGENHLLGSPNAGINTQCKESLTSNNTDETTRSSDTNDRKVKTSKEGVGELIGILDSLMQNERVCVFQHRRDSQKRARYKKIVRHHMDLDTIRSRIAQSLITSTRELFRDLLLLANNALIFYSKNTREHKCASLLRDLVTQRRRQYYVACGAPAAGSSPADVSTPPSHKKPSKARSTRPFNCQLAPRVISVKHDFPKPQGNAAGSPQSMESSAAGTKKSPGRRGGGKVERVKRGSPGLQAETPMKVRKRARAR